jgi:hypothetical protein
MRRWIAGLVVAGGLFASIITQAAAPSDAVHWVTGWAASAQGPYPVGNPSAQPEQ